MKSFLMTTDIAEQRQAELKRRARDGRSAGRVGGVQIRVAAFQRGDAQGVVAMLRRCSAATLYHRFHGLTDGVSHITRVLADAAGQELYGAWSGDSCIGLASLAVDGDGSVHIGVLVEDRWQRQGAGSALTGALVDRARDRQLPSLVADVLAEDQFIVPLLARISPITTSFVYGGYRVRLVLERGLCPAPLPGMDPGHDKRAESLGLRMPTRP